MEKNERKHLGKKQRIIIYTVAVILISFLLSLLLMFLVNDAFSLTAVSGRTEVIFVQDTGLYGASKVLKENGLIKSRVWFMLYSKLRGKDMTVKAGNYLVSNTGGFDGILAEFSKK